MICNKCGAKNPDDALYCSTCGAKLEAEVSSIADEPAAKPKRTRAAKPAETIEAVPAETAPAKKPRAKKATPDETAPAVPAASEVPVAQEVPAAQEAPAAPVAAPLPPVSEPTQQAPYNAFPNYTQPANNAASPYTYAGALPLPNKNSRDWAGIASLCCGIASVLCCATIVGGILFGLLGVIFGIIGLKSNKKSLAIVGLCLGALGLILAVIVVFSTAYYLDQNPAALDQILEEYNNAYSL